MCPAPARPADAYLRTKVMTAGSAELRLLLFDGAIKFAQQARDGLARRDYEATYTGISRTQEILVELINSLRPEHAPELCKRLSALYTFMFTRLIDASRARDPDIVDEVLRLLRYERETWAMLLEQLARENAAAAGLHETPAAPPARDAAVEPGTSGPHERLVGGRVSLQG